MTKATITILVQEEADDEWAVEMMVVQGAHEAVEKITDRANLYIQSSDPHGREQIVTELRNMLKRI